jgi:hypothetical protein
MIQAHQEIRRLAFVAAIFVVFPLRTMLGQEAEDTIVRRHIVVSEADERAAANVRLSSPHVLAAHIPGAREKAAALNSENSRRTAEELGTQEEADVPPPQAALVKPSFYPADLSKGTGVTLTSAVNHAVYVNYKGTIAANWGNPEAFLRDLFKDKFIHLTDQYTGRTTAGRYSVGESASVTYALYGNVLYEHELWAIVHSAAKAAGFGAGVGHIYHIFLPEGMDTCLDEKLQCYSPDNFNAWVFCAYHDAIDFGDSDIGVVFFTVEPYEAVNGCAVTQPYANSKLIDSTNSSLSHETFETITDPLVPTGWTNITTFPESGNEVADECQPPENSSGNFRVPIFLINGKKYQVQLEYSNIYHACAAQP